MEYLIASHPGQIITAVLTDSSQAGHPVKILAGNRNILAVRVRFAPLFGIWIVHVQAVIVEALITTSAALFCDPSEKVLIRINGIAQT